MLTVLAEIIHNTNIDFIFLFTMATAKSLQSCQTLCNPVDPSLLGSSVHGILQAIPEWVAISFSRGSSQLRDQTCISSISCIGRQVLYYWCHLGSLIYSLLALVKGT